MKITVFNNEFSLYAIRSVLIILLLILYGFAEVRSQSEGINTYYPLIYVFNGNDNPFIGSVYSGSTHPELERDDFLKLSCYSMADSVFKLKITSEASEVQHTNLMELWVFDHAEEFEVWVDKYGKVHTTICQISPLNAVNYVGNDITELLLAKDSLLYANNEYYGELPLKDEVVAEFPNPGNADYAKLLIRAKNSIVLDYMINEFYNLFGDAYGRWMKQQRKAPGERQFQWIQNQNIPLSVYIESNGNWKFIDYYNIAGPMALRDDVLTIPLCGNESETIRLKLEFGNFLWEIDYIALDYSTNYNIAPNVVRVQTAINQKSNKDGAVLLRSDDNKYLIQPSMDDASLLLFCLPGYSTGQRTIFLHSKGWYNVIRHPKGIPDRAYLESFREAGRFNRFVNERIQEFLAGSTILDSSSESDEDVTLENL